MRRFEKKLNLKIVLALIGVIFLASISLSISEKFNPVSMTAMPEVPKEGQPILITFNLNNPSLKENVINYEFYANGDLILKGKELISAYSTKQYTYLYPESPKLGDKITFLVKTESDQGSYEKKLDTPPYPPQILSSFVSFASFSTSIMSSSMSSSMTSSITSKQFYNGAFTNDNKLNVGLIISIVLILLLIYLELTEHLKERTYTMIGGMRIRFSRLSAVLFIIFIGTVLTKVVMIL